jgi:hypothetical protein
MWTMDMALSDSNQPDLRAMLQGATDMPKVFHIIWSALNQRGRGLLTDKDAIEIIVDASTIGLVMMQNGDGDER